MTALPGGSAGAQAPVPPPGGTATQEGTPLFGLRPGHWGRTTLEEGHYQYAVDPPAQLDDYVEVFNFTDEPVELAMYAADMVQSLQGGLAPAQAEDEQKEVGKWLVPSVSMITVPPDSKRRVSIHLEVPTFVSPGDHIGAIVAAKAPDEEGQGGTALAVETRVALTVRVRVPGEANLAGEAGPLTVSNVGGDRKFTVDVRNTGNLLFTIDGNVEIRGGDGVVAEIETKPEGIYVIPGGRARFEATWSSTPLFGGRTAVAKFKVVSAGDEKAEFESDSLSMTFFSWLAILIALVVLLGATVAFLIRRRRRGEESEAGAGEWWSGPPSPDGRASVPQSVSPAEPFEPGT